MAATTPDDPPHILKAKQAAAEQDLDLAFAFTASRPSIWPRSSTARPGRPARLKLRYILKNARKRYRQLKEILAAEDIPDARKIKKIRFVVNLLLPPANSKASVASP